jgi:hypothetical protein
MAKKAWVINLDRCPDNWAHMQKEWGHIFDLHRVSAVDAKALGITGADGCRQSHLQLFKQAVTSSDPYTIIMEDDIYRTAAWDTFWPKISEFLDKQYSDWDFISFDPNLTSDQPYITLQRYNGLFMRVNRFRNTGFIIYNNRFLKRTLYKLQRLKGAIDMTYTHDPLFRKLTPATLLVRQRSDRISEITGKAVTHYGDLYDKTADILLVAARNAAVTPGSDEAWPAASTTTSSACGSLLESATADRIGQTISNRP